MLKKLFDLDHITDKKRFEEEVDFVYQIRDSIQQEYARAMNSGDWSNSGYIQELYYNYQLNGGNDEYIKRIVINYQEKCEAMKYETETVFASGGLGGTVIAQFNRNAPEEPKPKPKELSFAQKIETVNKEIDDLLDFIESHKQARFNQYRKEFCK